MSLWWRNHIERSEQLLELVKAEGTSTARRLTVLYEVVTEITHAITDLEEHRNDD